MSGKTTAYKLVSAGLCASLVCLFTMFIKIELAFGYLNLGDVIIFMSAFVIPDALWCVAAVGLGSALADLLSGFPVYIPATFVIKSLTALAAHFAVNKASKKYVRILLLILAGSLIPLGYFLYESIIYGVEEAVLTVGFNALQGALGLFAGNILGNMLRKRLNLQ